ncbi:hypothetical protein BLNAU_17842 [Blattamonas nauphoetae]|uniref:Uncharacterized protein n=1 Tax=Blattamonas nauphoetae TaxID=2049346 RepID=A0ABQ9X6J8_9EUKA|nr:hypothetical protein BLNAU_17842 [Blattamonas nauphoetae]
MHQRFIDVEGSVVEADNHESDGDSIQLRSSRRNILLQPKLLDSLSQSISDHISKLSASLEKKDDVSLLSTLASIVTLTENSDDVEIVTVFLEENMIDRLLEIVSSNEDAAVLMAVYSLLALLTCVSVAVVSRIMVPDFLSKSLSLISPEDDDECLGSDKDSCSPLSGGLVERDADGLRTKRESVSRVPAIVCRHQRPSGSRKRCDENISELLEDDWDDSCDLWGACIFVRGTGTAGDDYEYFRAAVETDSQLEEPFDLLEPLKTAFRQHNFQRPLAYRESIQKFVLHDTVDHTLLIPHVLALINAQYSLMKNVLFLVGNALGGTTAHAEIVLSSLFPGFPATEATRKVIDYLQTLFCRLPLKLMKDLMRCVYVLADLPPEHQSVLVESEMLQFVWDRRRDLKSGAASFLVDSFILLLDPNDESSPTVARALLERIENESFASELDCMCNHRLPDVRECYERLRTFLETIPIA